MRSRTFLNVSFAILALAAAYHLGARNATAQSSGNPVVNITPYSGGLYAAAAITANGDVYATSISGLDHGWAWRANIFGGSPTPVRQESLGAVKVRYR
jgi:hypothetical protein